MFLPTSALLGASPGASPGAFQVLFLFRENLLVVDVAVLSGRQKGR
jgi:hypothetical protein